MKEELKSCPFCGNKAEVKDTDDGGSYVCCTYCNASSCLHYERKENLYSRWNDRTPLLPNEQRIMDLEPAPGN